ncbi:MULTISPECIES: SAM-dependent methyltransferase [Amycolatopsis]|uniref:SAM-dependent methyltransferase n=1 Tax=Amycolatopsis thermalba TaxID=944492 RepID=A0ABY4P2R7_9PSEU|nr:MULTISPECIES: SAM-dependent methyltransferase [Amycolatopsis]UQS26640.1 SAM-dependent methyltransferase [Amycolatopsis thermalba]
MTSDAQRPSAPRLYSLYLGGRHYGDVEQAFAEETVYPLIPFIVEWAQLSREFLKRAVRFCHEQGIRQFLDVGAGYPTPGGNVHELASGARVVYVDNDPDVVDALSGLTSGYAKAQVISGDLRRPAEVLRRLDGPLNLAEPTALLMNAVLHFIDQPASPVHDWVEALAPGSYLVISHGVVDDASASPDDRAELVRRYTRDSATVIPRTAGQISEFFRGLELVPPGLVPAADWRSSIPRALHDQRARRGSLAGVGYKPLR